MIETKPKHATALSQAGLTPDQLRDMARQMFLIREFEDAAAQQYQKGKIGGFLHLYQGQEASAVGAIGALAPQDFLIAHYRDHGHALARGVPAGPLMAELFGRIDGVCRGRGGSMHFFSREHKMFGGWAIVGGQIPVAVGLGFANEYRRTVMGENTDAIGLCILGDGATNIGYFYEALNFAALWDVPVIFYIENNGYAMGTALNKHSAVTDLVRKTDAFGIKSVAVDGMDVLAVRAAMNEAVAASRANRRPYAIEVHTYRYRAHSLADPDVYRDKAEVEKVRAQDPTITFPQRLIEAGLLTENDVKQMWAEARRQVEEAVAFAEASPEPPAEELTLDITATPPPPIAPTGALKEMTVTEALNEALDQRMVEDPRAFIMGEDINAYGGAYGVTHGLPKKFGDARVRDTPIAEAGIIGVATGAAMGGLRPIAELMTVNFSLLSSEALIYHSDKILYMFGDQANVPLVIRAVGGGVQLAATHSQNFDTLFAHIPGLHVAAVGTALDAKGLLATALRMEDPVVILENQLLYKLKGQVPEGVFTLPVGKAYVERQGKPGGVTLVAYSRGLQLALQAADKLAKEHGLEAEVINLRWLRPLDTETIVASVKKTNRVVVVEDDWRSYGIGAEVAARIQEEAFDWLDAPVARVAAAEVPMPYAANLERLAWPSVDKILAALTALHII